MFAASTSNVASRAWMMLLQISMAANILYHKADINTHANNVTYMKAPVTSLLAFVVKFSSRRSFSANLMPGK